MLQTIREAAHHGVALQFSDFGEHGIQIRASIYDTPRTHIKNKVVMLRDDLQVIGEIATCVREVVQAKKQHDKDKT